jgi:hypothetical protein
MNLTGTILALAHRTGDGPVGQYLASPAEIISG